jgi:hypothetical protein
MRQAILKSMLLALVANTAPVFGQDNYK